MTRFLAALGFHLLLSATAFANLTIKPLSLPDLFETKAVSSICASQVRQHPSRSESWYVDPVVLTHDDHELFALVPPPTNNASPWEIVATSLNSPDNTRVVSSFPHLVRDMEFHAGRLWVLFDESVLLIDPANGQVVDRISSHGGHGPSDRSARAHSLTFLGNTLLIAHGSRGLAIHDLTNKTMRMEPLNMQQSNGHRSKAIEVTVIDERSVLLGIDSVTQPTETSRAFNGLARINFSANSSVQPSYFPFDLARAGVLSYANIKMAGDRIVINNWGIIQLASLKEVEKEGVVRTQHMPIEGELLGEFYIDGGFLLGCSKIASYDPQTRKSTREGKVLKLRF